MPIGYFSRHQETLAACPAILYDCPVKMPNWRAQGRHRYYREEDLLYFEVHGPFELADARLLFEEAEAMERENGYILSAFDNRDGPGMTAEARRYTNMKSRELTSLAATAVIGASLTVRAMSHLLTNALRLAGRTASPVFFCATHEEAMVWLTDQRKRLRAAKK